MSAGLFSGSVGFVGAGALGTTLARAMHHLGYRVTAVASRTAASAKGLAKDLNGCDAVQTPQDVADRCDVVFLTVPDDVIEGVTSATRWRSGQATIHCSGATPLSALDSAMRSGAFVGAFHPLQTFGGPDKGGGPSFSPHNTDPDVLRDIAYAVEAEPPLQEDLEALAKDLGGWPVTLSAGDRVLYHVSAVAACGLLATLLKLSADLWSDFGQSSSQGLRALLPLVRGTLDGIERRGFPAALTGPAVRGDVGTVRSHIEALAARAPAFQPVYSQLALASLPIARAKGGLGAGEEEQLRELLVESLQNTAAER